jgi:hypothetical protein
MKYLDFVFRFALAYGLCFLVFVGLDLLFGDKIDWVKELIRPLVLFAGIALFKGLEILHNRLNK